MSKDQYTEVGRRVSAFERQYRVVNLRRAIDVALAQRGEKHQDAATRAGVTATWWSRIVNAKRITERDLRTIAKGIGTPIKRLTEELRADDDAA